METVITSANNSTIRHIRKLLADAKYRRKENVYVAEGIHLVRSFLESGQTPLMYACSEDALSNTEVADMKKILDRAKVNHVIVKNSLFESIANIHASVGILILFSPSKPDRPASLKQSAVLLEDVQDPGNIGTILRTTAAVGINDAFLSPGCSSPWSPKALRAGMGAQFGISIHENADLAGIINSSSVPIFATALMSGSIGLFRVDLSGHAAWIFGNEGQGVSETLLASDVTTVTIPQVDGPVESLNVAAAASVCLYEHFRQNQKSS